MKNSRISKWVIFAVLIGFALFSVATLYRFKNRPPLSTFRSVKVERGDIAVTITATGTIEPEEVIDVGAQVAGQILSFGIDQNGKSVDYGSVVSKGTVLARIDESIYAAESAIAEAELKAAKASLQRAKADSKVTQASFQKAERDWQRAKTMGASEALARSKYDEYLAAFEIGTSKRLVSEAAIAQAEAEIAKAEATLKRSNRNVGYCTITSPVDGIIIDRRVNIGQTVVSSLNAPTLFLLAKDLKRMQIWVAVNEADVLRIQPGQDVTFTIDALPDETFDGKVSKVRLNAVMTQNVVIYTVEVITDNTEGRFLPYLTANVVFKINKRSNVLLLPNTAFQWTPPDQLIDPRFKSKLSTDKRSNPQSVSGQKSQTIWVSDDGATVRPIEVQTGLSDAVFTEIMGDTLIEGQEVVVGVTPHPKTVNKEESDQKNPFMPSIPRGPGGGGGGPR